MPARHALYSQMAWAVYDTAGCRISLREWRRCFRLATAQSHRRWPCGWVGLTRSSHNKNDPAYCLPVQIHHKSGGRYRRCYANARRQATRARPAKRAVTTASAQLQRTIGDVTLPMH